MRSALRKATFGLSGIAACLTVATIGYAAISLDDTGLGFVGKGDVQLLFGWDNKKLQDCVSTKDLTPSSGCLQFDYAIVSTTSTESTWECLKTTVTPKGDVKEPCRNGTIRSSKSHRVVGWTLESRGSRTSVLVST